MLLPLLFSLMSLFPYFLPLISVRMNALTMNVPDEVILERGREGLRISAGGALGARDMSVGVVAQVTLRNELSRTGY